MNARHKAYLLLTDIQLDFLTVMRQNLNQAIAENRDAAYYENEVERPALVADIHRIGDAIEEAREEGASDFVIEVLIEQIQAANRARAANRERLKELADETATMKAMLAEVNRTISILDQRVNEDLSFDLVFGERNFNLGGDEEE